MVRIALIGAAIIAAVAAAPAAPIEIPSQISDAVPHVTGKPVVPFPDATKTGEHHHHTPTPRHHTPHSPHGTPGATPRPHHEGGHLPHNPSHILPRWLAPRATPEGIESNGHRGEKGEPESTPKHNPEFPEPSGAKGHHGHHSPTPTPRHHHTPTPGAHHGEHSGSFELPRPTGGPMLPGKGPQPSGRHFEPLTGGKGGQ